MDSKIKIFRIIGRRKKNERFCLRKNAKSIFWSRCTKEHKLKAGMLGALADFVILDPSYTLTVPMKQVISGAFDTLSHCMETYFGNPSENNVSDEITESIMRNVIRNIREVIKNPEDVNVRSELMWDSSIAECGLLKLGK